MSMIENMMEHVIRYRSGIRKLSETDQDTFTKEEIYKLFNEPEYEIKELYDRIERMSRLKEDALKRDETGFAYAMSTSIVEAHKEIARLKSFIEEGGRY